MSVEPAFTGSISAPLNGCWCIKQFSAVLSYLSFLFKSPCAAFCQACCSESHSDLVPSLRSSTHLRNLVVSLGLVAGSGSVFYLFLR